jgi:hemoglobin/transferrin/lactoferrin receptor protein
MSKWFWKILCAAGLLSILSMNRISIAEEEATQKTIPRFEDTVIVTATRSEISVDMTSKPVTVIDEETIATRNGRSLLDLLGDYVPGLSVSRSAATGGQVNLRGLSSGDKKAPLFVDGDRFSGRNILEYFHYDPSRIERIEVIRGPAATMYGTDAMGGLVNIITRRVKGEHDGTFALTPRLRALEYSTSGNLRGAAAELQAVGKKFDMLLGANARKAENFHSSEGEIPDSDATSLSIDFRLGYLPAKGHRIDLFADYSDVMDSGTAGGISIAPGYPYKTRRQKPMTEKMIKLRYTGDGNILGFNHIEASMYARSFYSDLFMEVRPKVNPLSSVTKVTAYIHGPLALGGKVFGVRSLKGKNNLTLGGDWFREKKSAVFQDMTRFNAQGTQLMPLTRSVSNPADSQGNIGLFAYDDWNPSDQWTVSAGGRLDYFQTSSDVPVAFKGNAKSNDYPLTGSLGAVYRPIPILHFTANASTSYRVPMPAEKFSTILGGYEPNSDLKPEKGRTYEAGARLRLSRVSSNLTLFQSDYDDLIIRQTVDSTVYPGTKAQKALNIGKARIKGVEWDATWLISSNWETFINAAYLHGSNTALSRPLAHIAPFNGQIGVRYKLKNEAFYIEATNRWSDRKSRIDISNERETAGYNVINLYGGFDLKRLSSSFSGMELRLSLENILDKAYSSPVTPEDITYNHSITNPVLEPGRRLSITLRSKF